MPGHTMHVISHTHWDREWYQTFQHFRMRLVDLMDNLLDILDTDPHFMHFNLDGQTILVEDYLQIRPDKRAVIERYVREGRLSIGPLYVLNDEGLVSGEATVRSFLIGDRMAREFGPVMKVGYLPDQFGNISQMPQILRGFGIDNAIFARGYQSDEDRKMEFWWQAPDGSAVLASFMAHWYSNAQRFPEDTDQALAFTTRLRDRMAPISHVDHLLFMNGVDHLEPQRGLPDILDRVNARLNGDKLVHSTLRDYIDAVRERIERDNIRLDTVIGELRVDHENSVFAGTLTSRMYLKQANERCQTALEKYAEPVSSCAYLLGRDYPQDFLNYAWKLLITNHPHDSICGCSIDQVHREMMPRFEQVEQIASGLTKRHMDFLASKINTSEPSLVVFNPLGWTRTDKVTAIIEFEVGDPERSDPPYDASRDVESIRLFDDVGNEVPISLRESRLAMGHILSPFNHPLSVRVRRFTIEFLAHDVPSCGYRTYRIVKSAEKPAAYPGPSLVVAENTLANEYLRLSVRDGSVRVERTDSATPGLSFEGLNTFEDGGDAGDEYNYAKPSSDKILTSQGLQPKVTVIDNSPLSATLKLEISLTLPAEISEDRQSRSCETVECPITTYLTITQGIPRVDVVTVVDNNAKDHRLRVLAPTGIDSSLSCAEGQFDVVERSPIPDDWVDGSPFHPQQRWVDVSDGARGLCLINKGLPEYELYKDRPGVLAMTLLRCTGSMSSGREAPDYVDATPEAQCLGQHTFEYAFYPHEADWQQAQVWKQAHQHNIPMLCAQTGAHAGELPPRHSFIEISHPELILSAAKKAEDSDLLVVRVFNTTKSDIRQARIRVAGTKSAKLLNLNEETIGEVSFADETVTLDVGAKNIVTLGFER